MRVWSIIYIFYLGLILLSALCICKIMLGVPTVYKERTVLDVINEIVRKHPGDVAIGYGGRKVTWSMLNEEANRAANLLLRLGVGRQDKVMVSVYTDKALEYWSIWLGAFKIGVVPAYLNYRYVGDEIVYVVNNADSKILFIQDDLLPKIMPIRDKLSVKHVVVIGDREKTPEGFLNYYELMKEVNANEPKPPWEPPKEDDTAFLLYTTGTTGKPKGVIYTYSDIVRDIIAFIQVVFDDLGLILDKYGDRVRDLNIFRKFISKGIHPHYFVNKLNFDFDSDFIYNIFGGDKFLMAAPLVTAIGIAATLAFWHLQHSIYYPVNRSFSPAEIVDIIEREGISQMLIVGNAMALPIVDYLKKESRKHDLSSLSVIGSIGMIFSSHLKKALLEYANKAVILDLLGSSETVVHSINISLPSFEIKETFRPGAIDRVYILNDRFEVVKPGEIGEIVALKHRRVSAYYNDPEKSAKTFRRMKLMFLPYEYLFVFTGDVGTYDENGEIKLMGRSHEIIDTGGLKVFAPEVAELLVRHPAVADAYVLGVPHERWGQMVVALVQLKPGYEGKVTEDELIRYCKQNMADYKCPKRIIFTQIPRDPTGKVPIEPARRIAQEKLQTK
jgi:fatty-acyl-CoA synthase